MALLLMEWKPGNSKLFYYSQALAKPSILCAVKKWKKCNMHTKSLKKQFMVKLYKSTGGMGCSPGDSTDLFDVLASVLQGDTPVPSLFILPYLRPSYVGWFEQDQSCARHEAPGTCKSPMRM